MSPAEAGEDTDAAIGGAEALSLEATADRVDDEGRAPALSLLNSRLPAHQELGWDDLGPTGPLRLHQATITRHFMLIRGGDARVTNTTDARLEVAAP